MPTCVSFGLSACAVRALCGFHSLTGFAGEEGWPLPAASLETSYFKKPAVKIMLWIQSQEFFTKLPTVDPFQSVMIYSFLRFFRGGRLADALPPVHTNFTVRNGSLAGVAGSEQP